MSRKKNRRHKSSSLSRSDSRFEPRPIFYIFCEGKKTEPNYFRALKQSLSPESNINVKFPSPGAVAHKIANKAVEFKNRHSQLKRAASSLNQNDQVWAVFDRDNHPNFDEAVRLCLENDIPIGLSNPCFEVWLILHLEDYGAIENSKKVKKHYCELIQNKTKWEKKNHYHKLVECVETAESRAMKLLKLRHQEGKVFGKPSTTVGKLTAAIRESNEKHLINSRSKSKSV